MKLIIPALFINPQTFIAFFATIIVNFIAVLNFSQTTVLSSVNIHSTKSRSMLFLYPWFKYMEVDCFVFVSRNILFES